MLRLDVCVNIKLLHKAKKHKKGTLIHSYSTLVHHKYIRREVEVTGQAKTLVIKDILLIEKLRFCDIGVRQCNMYVQDDYLEILIENGYKNKMELIGL